MAQPPDYDQSKGTPEVNYGYTPGPPMAGYSQPGAYGQPQYSLPIIQSQPGMGTTSNTTVIINQPQVATRRDWSSGTCDCLDDCGICMCGWCCHICLVCSVASDLNESMCVPLCVWCPITVLRTKFRTQNNIEGSIMNDCLMETCCPACTTCQLAREIKRVRMNNSIGM